MTKPRIIDYMEAAELIVSEANRMGVDWRYKDHYKDHCSYNPTTLDSLSDPRPGTPTGDHCIVGGVIEEWLGIRMVLDDGDEIAGIWDERRAAQTESASRSQCQPVRFTKGAIAVMRAAQAVQDNGATHGQALEAAWAVAMALESGLLVDPDNEN